MKPIGTELAVEVHRGEGVLLPRDDESVRGALTYVLRDEGVGAARVSVTFVTDAEITHLNEQYLSHEGPTDVISFPLHPPGAPPVGDIYIGVDQARRQAEELGVPEAEELLRLAIHGTLHVLGYDHPEGEERYESPMYRRQEELLGKVREQQFWILDS